MRKTIIALPAVAALATAFVPTGASAMRGGGGHGGGFHGGGFEVASVEAASMGGALQPSMAAISEATLPFDTARCSVTASPSGIASPSEIVSLSSAMGTTASWCGRSGPPGAGSGAGSGSAVEQPTPGGCQLMTWVLSFPASRSEAGN
jgi:hypothetical protein